MKWDVILGITSSVGLFHALFLTGWLVSVKKGNQNANLLLAGILLSFAIRIFKSTFYAIAGDIPSYLPAVGLLGMSMNGPLLIFYIYQLNSQPLDKWKRYVHAFLPLLALTTLVVGNDTYMRICYLIIILAQGLYIINAFRLISSWNDVNTRRWIRDLTSGFLTIEVVYFLQWTQLNPLPYVFATFVSSLILVVLTYVSVLKYDLFKKVHHSRLNKNDVTDETLANLLYKIIVEDEGFRDTTLTAKNLAHALRISPVQVSSTIQQKFNKTFPDFINSLRLDYVQKRLKEEEFSDKVESLAFDAGFQSPSTFYANFKKAYRMTPSEYKRHVRTDA